MKSKEFISMIKPLLRKEIKSIIKEELKQIIPLLKEEIKKTVKTDGSTSVTEKINHGLKLMKEIEDFQAKKYTDNETLQDVLAQTEISMRRGDVLPPNMNNENLLMENYDEWPTMNKTFNSNDAIAGVSSLQKRVDVQMIPTIDTEGRPINPNAVDPSVVKAITKNYKKLMDKLYKSGDGDNNG